MRYPGTRRAERLLTVVATCRQQARAVLDFLVAAGEAALRGRPPLSLLPALKGAERVQPVYCASCFEQQRSWR